MNEFFFTKKMRCFLLLFPFLFLACSHAKNVDSERMTKTISTSRPPRPVHERMVKSLIVLDAGHGGYDLGAHSEHCEEKNLALQTSLLVKKYLSEMGYRILLTRADDVFIPLKDRASIANKSHARLFLSIHYNAAKTPLANGVEVYYYNKSTDWRTISSKRLGRCILSRLLDRTKAASRGIKEGNFLVIRETLMPAILIEGGFITNAGECRKLTDKHYVDQIAKAIAEGVDLYCKGH